MYTEHTQRARTHTHTLYTHSILTPTLLSIQIAHICCAHLFRLPLFFVLRFSRVFLRRRFVVVVVAAAHLRVHVILRITFNFDVFDDYLFCCYMIFVSPMLARQLFHGEACTIFRKLSLYKESVEILKRKRKKKLVSFYLKILICRCFRGTPWCGVRKRNI